MTVQPVSGQRWVSDTEPELGLGIVLKSEFGRMEVLFPAANEVRQYAQKSAPLRRVQFQEGDSIKTHSGEEYVVDTVEDRAGILVYVSGEREIPEAELSDTISFSKPEDRLLAGQVDDFRTFELRLEALERRAALRRSPVCGYLGGRVDLIPHQMYIAREVATRLSPRVLLADEVGLGKTIEAGLILHRLHLTGRASRVLILVPEPLVHQWFVELLRRFNLMFSIFDEDRCEALSGDDGTANPFLQSQLILTNVKFLASDEKWREQAIAADWDLVIVDEAHHLEWAPEQPSAAYTLVEALGAKSPGLLLLTATPQQIGPEGHFARLRLLDPDRYSDLTHFQAEAERYEKVAGVVDRLLAGQRLTTADLELFGHKSARIERHLEEAGALPVKPSKKRAAVPVEEVESEAATAVREKVISEVLDEFGTGRVMFRNTRAALAGFPERQAALIPLDGDEPLAVKVKWLAELLKKLGEEKVLLICRTRELTEEIHEALQRILNVNSTFFHEGLSLLQRDRNAAYFSDEEGARILLCSEIGSEGRNFQFAHHLVLWDLPEDPELLEQRIGRLDRIGQTSTIHIHVPYMKGTGEEVLARWYHEGVNAFEQHPHGALEVLQNQQEELNGLREKFQAKGVTKLTRDAKKLYSQVAKKLERGHDRLLELNSHRPERAADTILQIRQQDSDSHFEEFVIRLMDHFGVEVEDHGSRSYVLRPGHLMKEALPGLTEDGLFGTFDRPRALSREDMTFLSGDHPLLRGALDELIGSESGNSSFAVWKSKKEAMLLEVCFVVECVAPGALHVDRFLPALPIRVAVDHSLADQSDDDELKGANLQKGDVMRLLDKGVVKRKLLPSMLKKSRTFAEAKMAEFVATATEQMSAQLDEEIGRLEDLRQINDHVRESEVEGLKAQKQALEEAVKSSRLRLDAVRLILRIP